MLAMATVLFFYTAAAILAGRGLLQPRNNRQPRSIPLTQIYSSGENTTATAAHAIAAVRKHQTDVKVPGPRIVDGGWWFGSFRVGHSRNLTLMVDTGSTDVAVNPGLYSKSHRGYATNYSASLVYDTTQPDGCGLADIHLDEYIDHVAVDGLFVPRQPVANVVAAQNSSAQNSNGTITQFPAEGIIGWTTSEFSQLNSSSWFEKICDRNAVAQCRFGIALGTDGKGEQYLGGMDSSLIKDGALTVAGVKQSWVLTGNVAINNTVVDKKATFLTDTGTVNIIGPIHAIQSIFNATGIRSNLSTSEAGCEQVLFGYYDCASPPQVGFSFPYNNTNTGDGAPDAVYNIEPKAFAAADDGKGTCTSTLIGIDFPSSSNEFWVLGQSWFQGKYVDHNFRDMSMGIGTLVNRASKVK